LLRILCPHQTEGTFKVNNTVRRPKITVSVDGAGQPSTRPGVLLLAEALRVTGLGEGLPAASARHIKMAKHRG
jgi:hypothetical protein